TSPNRCARSWAPTSRSSTRRRDPATSRAERCHPRRRAASSAGRRVCLSRRGSAGTSPGSPRRRCASPPASPDAPSSNPMTSDPALARRALLLSGHFGKGHDVVAEACGAALEPYGIESRMLDAIALLGSSGGAAGDWVFRHLLAIPALYDAFHFAGLRQGGALARWLDRRALDAMWPAFEREAAAFPPDLVVSVFATGAAAAARLKREQPAVVTVVLCTDSYVHRLWVHAETDLFLVTSRMAAESVR